MSFELAPKGKKGKKQKTWFEFFVEHFGQIEVAPRYKITVEVAKSPRSSTG